MIAIAESGSTKTDWVILNNDLTENFRTNTIGFNPYHIGSDSITKSCLPTKNCQKLQTKSRSLFLRFGLFSRFLHQIVEMVFALFQKCRLAYRPRPTGACYAVYRGEPAMVCILGTGSTRVILTEKIKAPIPRLHSGRRRQRNYMGKKLLRAYFSKKCPNHCPSFWWFLSFDHQRTQCECLSETLGQCLFGFVQQIHLWAQTEPFIQHLIFDSMAAFFENQYCPIPNPVIVKWISSVQSLIIMKTSSGLSYRFIIWKSIFIVKKPIDNLIEYHKIIYLNEFNSQEIAVISYNTPHRKTQDVLFGLKAKLTIKLLYLHFRLCIMKILSNPFTHTDHQRQ